MMTRVFMRLAMIVGFLASGVAARAETEILTGAIPPYSFEENAVPQGLVYEIVKAMAPLAGHSGAVRFVPWNRALTIAREPQDKVPRLIFPLNRSPERESQYVWAARLFVDETVFVTRVGGTPRVVDPKKSLDLHVGALLGSPLEAQLRELGFKNVEPGADEAANARKLHAGRLDAWFVAALVAPYVYKQNQLDPKELVMGGRLRLNDLHLGATKDFPKAELAKWATALETIKSNGTYARVLAKWNAKNASQ